MSAFCKNVQEKSGEGEKTEVIEGDCKGETAEIKERAAVKERGYTGGARRIIEEKEEEERL